LLLVCLAGSADASRKIGDLRTESLTIGNGTVVLPFNEPAGEGATFSMLHFENSLEGLDAFTVQYEDANGANVVDEFRASSGSDFWTRPIRGDSPITLGYTDDGDGLGSVRLDKWGIGLGIQNGGADVEDGGNGNGDLFLLSTPFENPTVFASYGLHGGGTPSWQNVAALNDINDPGSILREAANATGMMVFVDEAENKINTCSASLIDRDLILTCAHCLSYCGSSATEVPSGSFTPDFFTDVSDNRVDHPDLYNPQFYRMTGLVKCGWLGSEGLDYAVVQIDAGPDGVKDRTGAPIAPVKMKPLDVDGGLPRGGERVYVIHHPRAATKKISGISGSGGLVSSVSPDEFHTHNDVDHGSSGAPVFDAQGSLLGIATWASGGGVATSTAAIQRDLDEDLPSGKLDVMIAFDRSGSMNLPSGLGTSKLTEAQEAVSLFLDLVDTSRDHQVGLVSFSTSANSPAPSPNVSLAPATQAAKTTLIGPDRRSGIVWSLSANGMTSIGDGLRVSQNELDASTNTDASPALLLLTDGLHNTPPSIESINLDDTRLNVIGFGEEWSLDGPRLTRLSREHRGLYTRAGDGLALKKYFALAFGEIFETGATDDPYFTFAEDSKTPDAPFSFDIENETELTVVMGWEIPSDRKRFVIETPSGNVISPSFPTTPGITTSFTDTWGYIKVPLPFNGEREGEWKVHAERGFAEEFFSANEERFFLSTIVDGGPTLRPLRTDTPVYTGDVLNPLVVFRNEDGVLLDATARVEVIRPSAGVGNFLRESGLRGEAQLDGDRLDPRAATLVETKPSIPTITQTFPLFDDALHEDRGLERDGIFGNPLEGLTRHEGSYTFRAVASYGDGQTRETSWSIHVDVGIDIDRERDVVVDLVGTLPDGRRQGAVVFTPRDIFENYLGPGRADAFVLHLAGPAGSELVGPVRDNGDGSYTQEVKWNPEAASFPTLVLGQEGRTPELILPEPTGLALGLLALLLAHLSVVRRQAR
jgi:hypothetical protein